MKSLALTDEREPRPSPSSEWLRLELEEGRTRKGRMMSSIEQRSVEESSWFCEASEE